MTGRHWAFIAGRHFLPPAQEFGATALGGTEQAIIQLTAALAARGDTVTLCGAAAEERELAGVVCTPHPPPAADIHVAINDARLLPGGAAAPTVWFHNEVEWLKELRRRRMPALLRHRPTAIFIGQTQAGGASRLLPFRSRHVIPYGLSNAVLTAPTACAPPSPHALFTSQAYRGLREVMAMWRTGVAPRLPGARLTAHVADADLAPYRALVTDDSISIAPRIGNDAILARLHETRVLLAPGHVSETFCLAAAEAIALGVPVITLGIGSLKERVTDGVNGYVCDTMGQMAEQTLRVLTDDAVWCRLHRNGIASRAGHDWASVALQWAAL